MLTPEDTKEIQSLFQQLGIVISDEEACFHATQLAHLLRATYKDDT